MALPNPSMSFSPFAILTAEEMNDLVENIEALADGSGLNDGAVTSTKLDLTTDAGFVSTGQSTSVQTFGDNLATVGPSATVVVGSSGKALVNVYSYANNNTVNSAALVGINVSGANTIAAADDMGLLFRAYTASQAAGYGATFLYTGLTPGSTTFKLQYRASANTATFLNRRISVVAI